MPSLSLTLRRATLDKRDERLLPDGSADQMYREHIVTSGGKRDKLWLLRGRLGERDIQLELLLGDRVVVVLRGNDDFMLAPVLHGHLPGDLPGRRVDRHAGRRLLELKRDGVLVGIHHRDRVLIQPLLQPPLLLPHPPYP